MRRTLLAVVGFVPSALLVGCLAGSSVPGDDREESRAHERVVEIDLSGGPLADSNANEQTRYAVVVLASEEDLDVLRDGFFDDEPDVRSLVEGTDFGQEGIVILQGVFESTRYQFDVDSLTLTNEDDLTGQVDVETLEGGEDSLYRETVFVRTEAIQAPVTSVTLTIREGGDETTVTA